MYLLDINISGIKLLRDFSLSLRDTQGRPRMWTVLIAAVVRRRHQLELRLP